MYSCLTRNVWAHIQKCFTPCLHNQLDERQIIRHVKTSPLVITQKLYRGETRSDSKTQPVDGLLQPSVYMDGFVTTYMNLGVTLTFDLQNLIRSSVGLVNLPCQFYQKCGNNIWPDKWTNGRTNGRKGQPKNIMTLPTLSGAESIKNQNSNGN